MTAYYLDTSALVKRYVTERGSSWVEQLIAPDEHDLYAGRLTATRLELAKL